MQGNGGRIRSQLIERLRGKGGGGGQSDRDTTVKEKGHSDESGGRFKIFLNSLYLYIA